jgi:hypothetical protein
MEHVAALAVENELKKKSRKAPATNTLCSHAKQRNIDTGSI